MKTVIQVVDDPGKAKLIIWQEDPITPSLEVDVFSAEMGDKMAKAIAAAIKRYGKNEVEIDEHGYTY